MNNEDNIKELLDNPEIKSSLDLRNYYILKSIYDKNFSSRSKIFSRKLLEMIADSDKKNIFFVNNINEETNEEKYMRFIDSILEKGDCSIIDDNDYIISYLLKMYIFSKEPPENSLLFLTYHLFCTNIELLFCLNLVRRLPNYCYLISKREKSLFLENHRFIQLRVNLFLSKWCDVPSNNKKNPKYFFEILISKFEVKPLVNNFVDLSRWLNDDPLLPNKLISHNKLMTEGIFSFDFEEITRQICLIDHNFLRKVLRQGISKIMKKPDSLEEIKKIMRREKQFFAYILNSILNQNTLEHIKIVIQNFIKLAYTCRKAKNYQTSFTIISCFYTTKLRERKIIWNMIEKKYKEIYLNMEKDYLEVYLKEFGFDNCKISFIPNIHSLICLMHKYLSRCLDQNIESLLKVSIEFKEINIFLSDLVKNKLYYFKVNPLYDFLKFGFLELFQPKRWKLKVNSDFTYLENLNDDQRYSVLVESLIDKFENTFKIEER